MLGRLERFFAYGSRGAEGQMPLQDDLVVAPDLGRFFTAQVLDGVPHVFAGDRAAYVEWRSILAESLDVDAHDVVIVGSAALGVSIAPGRRFRAFGDGSDIDVGIISSRHFEAAWHFFRNLTPAGIYALPRRTQASFREHAPRDVYHGVIATERFLPHLPFGPKWTRGLARMAQRDPTRDRDVNARLYRDVESLRSYQVRSLRQAREELL